MSAQPAIDLTLPLSAEKSAQLERLVQGLDSNGLLWISGYAAGLARSGTIPSLFATPAIGVSSQHTITVLYGTQTGNSRTVAEKLKSELDGIGTAARLLRVSEYRLRDLKGERYLLVVISTQGDGDPPDDSRAFIDFIKSKKAPPLNGLSYAVLALGDSSYPKYCAVGREVDERLAALGAKRLSALGECDLEFEQAATSWIGDSSNALKHALKPIPPLAAVTPLRKSDVTSKHDRKNPFGATLLTNQRISGRDANKDVRHIELGLSGAGIEYEPGDALGIWPRNPRVLVQELLDTLQLRDDIDVTHGGRSLPLGRWLGEELEITRLARPIIAGHAERAHNTALEVLLRPEAQEAMAHLLRDYQLIDLLRTWPGAWSAQDLVATLRPLTPRSYSIASSRKVVDDEAHLTVAVVDYVFSGTRHLGAASRYLADSNEDAVRIYLESNPRFRLPSDSHRDVIMIGPGTGVAPFRAFVQERVAVGAKGRNWLVFGEQHFQSQFLYQVEWIEALKSGHLHRIDLAFSRDQAEKIYVQHRLTEQGADLFAWLEEGAHLYVCGDASRMAKDVHAALVSVVEKHGKRSLEDAEEYLTKLAEQGRYARDIY